MKDADIIERYWRRDESAIALTQERYGSRLYALAVHILGDREDSAESVNDTYLKAWDSIPPQRPERLEAYLCHILRQTAIDRWRRRGAAKRPPTEYALSLEELAECVGGGDEPAQMVEARALGESISRWLELQPLDVREAFVRRYYFMDPLCVIAERQGCGVSRVKSVLFRARQSLRTYLKKEGFDL